MSIADDIRKHLSILDGSPDSTCMHIGVARRSGRYPWGSGENPYQHVDWYSTPGAWLRRVRELEKMGWKDSELAERFQLGTVDFRAMRAIAVRETRLDEGQRIKDMLAKNMTYSEVGRQLGINESSVRSKLKWFEDQQKPDASSARTTADYLKEAIKELGGPVDVGEGVARKLGITEGRLDQALAIMQNEGYSVKLGMMDRATDPTSNKKIIMKVVGEGELPDKLIRDHIDEIHSLNEMTKRLTEDGEKIRPSFVFPESLDISRLKIIHGDEEGLDKGVTGNDKDGLVEIRRGVEDLNIGNKNYAQVRVLVDGDRYIKGMAIYRDGADMPDGVDIVWNTNKSSSKPDRDILKEVKLGDDGQIDKDNPFGALIREDGGQTYYNDPNGKYVDPKTGEKQSLNKVNMTRFEGDWNEWADKVPAQLLSKQPAKLVRDQLDFTIKERQLEFDEIMSIDNPTIRRDQLIKFADSCDTASASLKAAAFPGQKYKVILPLASISDNEVYAPGYQDGQQVALVRYPHGGTFEIPILSVNNKNAEGRRAMTNTPLDAIGINKAVADRLSGADFDGDTVQIIPISDRVNIHSTRPLPGLVGFDPKVEYGTNDGKMEGVRYMKYDKVDPKTGKVKTIDNTQKEMGMITNLISDMSLQDAPREDLELAVKHSMVVIDAAKHKLDYKRSEIENHIPELKAKYQGRIDPETGKFTTASATIVSRAGAQASTERTVGQGHIDPDTGKMVYRIDTMPNAKGKQRMQQTKQMLTVDNAFELVHNNQNPVEIAYAKYANSLKSFAKKARLEVLKIKEKKRDPEAAREYADEVASLTKKLERSQANQDVERWAQLMANQRVAARKAQDPSLKDDKARLKKLRQQYLSRAREETGAKRIKITIGDREWEAIQKGAVGHTTLSSILKYADPDDIKQRSMPRSTTGITPALVSRVKLLASYGREDKGGYTQAQIADRLGISTSTVTDILNGKG